MEYVERDIKERFQKIVKEYKIIALVGARQSGKTTFLKKNSKEYNSEYVLFDDPDAKQMFEEDIKKFELQYLNKPITILDEVHYCKDAGAKLKYLADSGYKLWITSSSEMLLSKEILSYLVGRVSIIKTYPFSLEEFLKSKNQKQTNKKILQRNIYEHCLYGGYPKIVTTKDKEVKRIMLGDLYETMILKDVARNFSIEDITALEKFVRYLSYNIGNLISYGDISSNLNISFQTMKKYLDAMEKSYLLFRSSPFFKNKMKEISKQPKIYFVDTGLRNYISKTFPEEIPGELFENYVLSELLKLGFSPKYWRTKSKSEVDFIIEKDNEIIPIEVKTKVSPKENGKKIKIEKSLQNFIKEYKVKKAIIVNYGGVNRKQKQLNCEIIFSDVINLKNHINRKI